MVDKKSISSHFGIRRSSRIRKIGNFFNTQSDPIDVSDEEIDNTEEYSTDEEITELTNAVDSSFDGMEPDNTIENEIQEEEQCLVSDSSKQKQITSYVIQVLRGKVD